MIDGNVMTCSAYLAFAFDAVCVTELSNFALRSDETWKCTHYSLKSTSATAPFAQHTANTSPALLKATSNTPLGAVKLRTSPPSLALHTCTLRSPAPLATKSPLGDHPSAYTVAECLASVCRQRVVAGSHIRTVESKDALQRHEPAQCNAELRIAAYNVPHARDTSHTHVASSGALPAFVDPGPVGAHLTRYTAFLWPVSTPTQPSLSLPAVSDHRRAVPSSLPVASRSFDGLHVSAFTSSLCPTNVRTGARSPAAIV